MAQFCPLPLSIYTPMLFFTDAFAGFYRLYTERECSDPLSLYYHLLTIATCTSTYTDLQYSSSLPTSSTLHPAFTYAQIYNTIIYICNDILF